MADVETMIEKIIKNKEFDNNQMEQIRIGFQNNLSTEQIKLYADPKFTSEQMEQIRYGLQDNLPTEKIKLYADQKFNQSQMGEIRAGFNSGLSIDQVKVYADPNILAEQMKKYKQYIINKIPNPKEYIEVFEKYQDAGMEEEQARIYAEAAGKGVSKNKLDLLASKNLPEDQIQFLLRNIQRNENKCKNSDTKHRHNREER